MLLRLEEPADLPALRDLHRLAFGGEAEAALVDALRAGGHVPLSLVAEDAGELLGHVLFSELAVEGAELRLVALAPMAVLPTHQRRGIGADLIREGLGRLRSAGYEAVLVLGHPDYYPRFGFQADLARGLMSPYAAAGEAYMALELRLGALAGVRASVRYAAPFAELT